jgi:molecular chaperone GrpE
VLLPPLKLAHDQTDKRIEMTGQPKSDPPEKMDQAIQDAMAAAEAAVSAVRGDESEPEPDPEPEPEANPAPANAELEAQVNELKEQLSGTKDRWLRAVADHENAKKRAKREMEEAINRSLQKVLADLLPVGDNLDRALAAASEDDQLAQGVRMVKSVFDSALTKHGIEPILTKGQSFDPALHDALQQVDSPEHAPGEIIQEFERGYTRNGKLFRPARVIVAGPGSTGAPSHAPESGPAGDNDSEDSATTDVADNGEEQ